MRDLCLLLGALAVSASVSAAGCGPASFPDQSAVAAAQAGWCQALAKMNGGASWEHLNACKDATPTGSAPYVRGMTKCFPARREAHGESAPDVGIMVAECKDEVLFKLTIDEVAAQEAIAARCDRAARCEKASVPECVAAAKRTDAAQRATLYGIYNGAAVHTISECLRSSACGADEYAAQESCYRGPVEKLLWFP
jgi:hypothetical protein